MSWRHYVLQLYTPPALFVDGTLILNVTLDLWSSYQILLRQISVKCDPTITWSLLAKILTGDTAYLPTRASYYTPHTTKLFGGILVTLRTSVCPSVRPASRVCSVAPTVLVWSISYLCILLSNLRRCVTCKVSCSILKFEFLQFLKFITLTLFCFDFGIWCESLVGVIMGWRGYLRTQAF